MTELNTKKLKLIAFDLDNTLYDETNYFKYGIKKICLDLEKELNFKKSKTEKIFWKILDEKGKHYHYLFDDFLKEVNLEKKIYLPKFLNIFSKIDAKLKLFPNVENNLKMLKEKFLVAIITNGRYEIQKNKIDLLGIEPIFDFIIYASKLKNDKPSSIPYQYLLDKAKIFSENMIYVGDNPLLDFKGAKKLKITTVRIKTKEFDKLYFKPDFDADIKIKTFNELFGILNFKSKGN